MTKETKYFFAGTDEEVILGDVIETSLVKEFENGSKITRSIKFCLTEETIPEALSLHIIEEKEVLTDDNEESDDDDFDCPLEEIFESIEDLEGRVEDLEKKYSSLTEPAAKQKNFNKTNPKKDE